jgi:hypothetical protein
MSQMTYSRTDECRAIRCDIRPLFRALPQRMLKGPERSAPALEMAINLPPDTSTTGLEVCLVCGRDFVSMVRCTKAGGDSWWLLLRCGDCGTWHDTFARDDAVAALHKAIARGRRTVAEGVRSLDLERMGAEVEVFAQALDLDLIDADDF